MKFLKLILILITIWFYHTPASNQEISRVLAEIAIETKSESITPAAYKSAKEAVIDVMAVSVAAYDIPGVKEVTAQMIDWGGKGESTAWFYGDRMPAPNAVFVNSVLAHALDLDDLHPGSSTHITCIVVPVAFAIGEMQHSSGREVLEAIIMGIEVSSRLGNEYRPRREHGGFLPSSIIGGFGAVAASARLMGLSVEQAMDAYGIFYAHASGNRSALFDHTLTKRIQPAIAAKAGVKATFLARRGISGPRNIFLGSRGLFIIYGGGRGEPPTAEYIGRAKDYFEVERLAYKKYVACGASHAAIEAAINLSTRYNIKLEDVKQIEIGGIGVGGMVGAKWYDAENPHVLAQFSAPYQVAAAIKYRRFGPAEIENERIANDIDVQQAARKVKLDRSFESFNTAIDSDREFPPGERFDPQGVRITLKDGTVHEEVQLLFDVLRNPDALSYEDIVDKFKELAEYSGIYDKNKTGKMLDSIESLDKLGDINSFVYDFLRGR